jgi:hypothetical protein
MKFIVKTGLFLFLSFSLPVGRLFDLFVWDKQIVRTEARAHNSRTIHGYRIISYGKHVLKKLGNTLSQIRVQLEHSYRTINMSKLCQQILLTQQINLNRYIIILIQRPLFETYYLDCKEKPIPA